jgi:hypothetical protein
LAELSAKRGIGAKKLHSLIRLLHRATKDHPPEVPLAEPPVKAKGARSSKREHEGFNPSVVSELLWEQWRQTVKKYGLERELLGRLAPSLQKLPTVIWREPLATYIDSTLASLRGLKTYGEKRIQGILEVFYSIHELLVHVPHEGHLRIDIRPKFTLPIEQWIHQALARSQPPTVAELKQQVIVPIVEQLGNDAGPDVFRLVEERLGIKKAPLRVQVQAKRLGVTRARVYQLLEACCEVMAIRWPEGAELFLRLYHRCNAQDGAKAQVEQLRALMELIYPGLDYTASLPALGGKPNSSSPRPARGELGNNGHSNPPEDRRRDKSSGASPRAADARG